MKKIKFFAQKLRSYFPSLLPVGVTEFNAWSDSIIALAGPYSDRDSMAQALANMVMHAGPKKGTDMPRGAIPKNYFVNALRKGAANQVASYVFQEIRNQKQAAVDAAVAAAKAAEETKQPIAEVTAFPPQEAAPASEKIGLQ